ncbi:MAG: translocation/assembly module TamB domain-containing protein [Bacteroidales bacterium]|nr:translocation/assembly module TamB domain-containing protein [Bacteroidales bacterium]
MLITLIVLVVSLLVVAEIPAVQTYFAKRVSVVLGDKLGTQVHIGKVSFSLFDRVVLHDVTLYDQSERTMLEGKHIAARVSLPELAMGQVTLHAVELLDVRAQLYKRSASSSTNFQFVIDAFSSSDTTTKHPLRLRINSIIMRRLAVSYDEYYKDERADKALDWAHLRFTDINANLSLKALREDSLNLRVRELTFNEQSGLSVQRLAVKAVLGANTGHITNLDVALPNSRLTLDTLRVSYSELTQLTLEQIQLAEMRLLRARIIPKDLAFLVPALSTIDQPYNLVTQLSVDDKRIRLHGFRLDNDQATLRLNTTGEVVDWRDTTKRVARANVEELYASATTISRWYGALTHKALPDVVRRLGSLYYNGRVSAFRRNYHTDGVLRTAAGSLRLDASLHNGENYAAKIASDALDLHIITAKPLLGSAAFALESQGRVVKGEERVQVKGSLPWITIKGYRYQNVAVNAMWQPNLAKGQLSIDDPNASLRLEAAVKGVQQKHKDVVAEVAVKHIRPHKLGLKTPLKDTDVSLHLLARVKGSGFNDLVGQVDLQNASLIGPTRRYNLKRFNLTAFFDDTHEHVVRLNSDFMQAQLRGYVATETLPQALLGVLGSHIPSLGLGHHKQAESDFVLTAKILKSDVLTHFLDAPFNVVAPISMHVVLNEHAKAFSMTLVGDSLQVSGQQLRQVRVFCKNYDDKTHLLAQAIRSTEKTQMQIVAEAEGKADQVKADLHWVDQSDASHRGSVQAVANVMTDTEGGKRYVLSILPSDIVIGGSIWSVNPAMVIASKQGVQVDSLRLRNGHRFVLADGVYSKHSDAKLAIRVGSVDLAYVFDLLNFHAVDFKGRASIEALVSATSAGPELSGKVYVDDFTFNDAAMGRLSADAQWRASHKQVELNAQIVKSPTERTLVSGYVSPSKSSLDLMIRGEHAPVGFLGGFLGSIFNNLDGKATGWTRLYGKFSNLNLEGQQVVDIRATIPTLGVTYALRGDTIRLSRGRIDFDAITLYDEVGNSARVSGVVTHDDLRHMTYDFSMDTERLRCYDTQQAKGELFYGVVVGKGKARLYGQPGVTTLEANVEALRGSQFNYNASRPAEVSGSQLLTFTDRTEHNSIALKPHASQASETGDLHLHFNIEATPEATLRIIMDEKSGDDIVFHGNGALRASYYNKDQFRLFGTYHITDGLYRMSIKDVIRKDFRFREGSTMVFRGPMSDGELNLHASYLVPSVSLSDLSQSQTLRSNNVPVECLLDITGKIEQPQVAFGLHLPTLSSDDYRVVQQMIQTDEERNRQVIYLLSFGRFYSFDGAQNNTTTPTQDASLTAMNGFLSSALSTTVSNVLDDALNLRNIKLGTNISTGNDGWNNVEIDGLLSGRFFNNRLVFDAMVGYREKTFYNPNASNFVGDFNLRWLLNHSGTLSLKAYSETNDRYFIRSALTTQGVGLVATREFGHFSELFRWLRSKPKLQPTPLHIDSVQPLPKQ